MGAQAVAQKTWEVFKKAVYPEGPGEFMERLEIGISSSLQEGDRGRLVLAVWGYIITIIDLERGKVYRLITRRPYLKEVIFQKSSLYPTIESCIKEFLFGSSWFLVGQFRDLSAKEAEELANRLIKEGINTVKIGPGRGKIISIARLRELSKVVN